MFSMDRVDAVQEEKLIGLVRDHKVLYDKRVDGYHKSKDLVWENIAGQMNKEGFKAEYWQKTWKNIRNQYMAYRRKLKKPSGSASGRKPYFRHAESMGFLKDSLGEEETYSNLNLNKENENPTDQIPESDTDEIIIEDATKSKTVPDDHRSHTKFSGKRKLDSFDESLLDLLKSDDKDEFSALGELVALKLRKISEKDKRLAVSTQQTITTLIHDAEMELL